MNKSILVIDDDVKLSGLLEEYLGKYNFQVTSSETPGDGLARLKANHYDLVILDIMLPEMDGFETCKLIRKDYEVPIVMLTARGEVTDKIVGLELGADDYLPKPFEPRELLARIQSVLRRVEQKFKKNETLKFDTPAGYLIVDPNKRTAFLNDKDLELTSTEFELLMLFVKHNGKVLSRDEIMQNTRGISWMSFDRSVDVMVSRLRNKLKHKNAKKDQVIKTVHTVGYMFFAEAMEQQ
jgi:DNA-binding response OmpR family regulator